jgi:hypothetical protein
MQTNLFNKLFQDGNTSYTAMRYGEITDLHRVAAKWLCHDRDDLPWLIIPKQVKQKDCPACAERIAAKAEKCRVCGEDLVQYYKKRNRKPDPLKDPYLSALIEEMEAVKAAGHYKTAVTAVPVAG